MGAGGEDVLLSPAARRKFPVSIECKSVARFVGYTHMEQAKENAPKGAEPVVVMRANRKEPVVIVDADYFFRLLAKKS